MASIMSSQHNTAADILSGRILAPLSLLIFKIISYFNTNRNTVPGEHAYEEAHGYDGQGGQGTA